MHVGISPVKVVCLHCLYNTPVCEIYADYTEVKVEQKVDHMFIKCYIRNIILSDLTNYPQTLLPQEYAPEKVKPLQILGYM